MSWILVNEYEQITDEVRKEKKRWEDVAEDVGLIPERNVRIVEENGKVRLEISLEMHEFFSGTY